VWACCPRQNTFAPGPHLGFLEVHGHDVASCTGFLAAVGQQDAHVLDRGDQVILNLLSPEPSPTRSFEVMIVGRIGKATFREMLPAAAVALGGAAVRLAPRYIQEGLFFVSFDGPPVARPRALAS